MGRNGAAREGEKNRKPPEIVPPSKCDCAMGVEMRGSGMGGRGFTQSMDTYRVIGEYD